MASSVTPECSGSTTKDPPSIEMLTHVFRELLVLYLDPQCAYDSLRFLLGAKSSMIFDAIKRGRQEGVRELLHAIDNMEDKRGVAKKFMDSLKKSGNRFLYDVIYGVKKLDDSWELKNLLLGTEEDLIEVPPLELLPHLTSFENHEKEAIRTTANTHPPRTTWSELCLRLQAKPSEVMEELINGLREINYPLLAQSLEDAYRGTGKDSRGDPDGHDNDDDDSGGPAKDPKNKERPSNDKHGPDDDKPDSGDKPDSSGAGPADDGPGGQRMSNGERQSGDEANADSVSPMLGLLQLSDAPGPATPSSTATVTESNIARSTPMTLESLHLHDYQEELAEHSLKGKNSVIVAPTGSGKTRVAIAIAMNALMEQNGASQAPNKVVFIVNKVALVEQQKKAFQEFIPEVDGISGDMSSQVPLVHQLEQADVVVLTSQILLNALQDGSFSLSSLRLIILDECHNTQKENPYNSIMAFYRDLKKRNQLPLPQVVGLTASLGVKKAKRQRDAVKHVLKLCANLDADEISTVVRYRDSLKRSYHTPKEETIGVEGRDDKDPFKIELGRVMEPIEQTIVSILDKISAEGGITGKKILECRQEMTEMSSFRGTQQYEGVTTKLLQFLSVEVNDSQIARVLQDCANFLKVYNESLYINRDARTVDALNHIKSFTQNLIDMKQNTEDSVDRLIKLFEKIKPKIKEICHGPSNENPVLKCLEKILIQEYKEKEETLAILFTNTRDSTRALQAWIQETPSLASVNPGTLIGTGGSTGMTQTQQEQLLAMFKEKKHKLVISTSVAEEGLDIQMCNLVVRYNYVRDDIARVQARGRSRAEGGKFYLVFNKRLRKLAEREKMNRIRERMMEEATETVCGMIKDNKQEYLDNIAELQRQDASERSLQRTGRLAAEKKKSNRKVHKEVKLLCKHCREFICYTEDIRSINGQHHIVIKESFRERIITERFHEDQTLYGDVKVSQEVQCKRCKQQLGYMMIFREHELPLLSIRYLVIEVREGIRVHKKKWSDTTSLFTIKDIDLEDLARRLEGCVEDEESEDGTIEKEQ
ncbi:antiviral innate immune response receptor RIG-I-like isoform X2 [Lytechinus variegatus]|uniref:antiviral innate immune response receptor RIG-I-like isoform X2 n=1 Tax=Lytechinus variegatus TaxID=7654 RepID=UPI001BB0ED60|nr:antiviral innate immune response receptor RIG-I-like isoform X2 [Lytechinus variegatus]